MGEKDSPGLPLPDSSPITHHPSPSFIDTHCHIEMKEFDADREEVIKRAREAGLEAMITIGSDLEGTLQGVQLAELYDFIYCSVGIHPHEAKDFTDQTYALLQELTQKQKVIALGETGLDYHYDHSPRDLQRIVFRKQLELANETGLPVIIHSREADEDTLNSVRESGVSRGVFHCFSGNEAMAEQVMALGFYISIAGPVTFRKAVGLQDIARRIPDDYLLIETDAPYLTPEPFRGRRNEPAFIVNTAKKIAELRGISLQDLSRITTLNARRLFSIGTVPEKGEITYQIRDSLYLNITNRCTNKCSFCVKFNSDFVKGHRLSLSHEPSVEELKKEIGDPSRFKEIVFCGYGEPLERLDVVKQIAQWVKDQGGSIRINTNGHANLIHRRDIIPELKGLVDSVSISLDAQDAETYNRICRPSFPQAYEEVLSFTRRIKDVVPDVQVTIVNLPEVDVAKCAEIAKELGVKFRVREFNVVG
ncbi:MAG: YchF/TatD family DNA exonuclease [Nitrospirae bacterium]|nr:YchF/TatD family DNA exonuclease [Nitrospirota bacterium]